MLTFNRNEAREIISEASKQPKAKQKYNITIVPNDFRLAKEDLEFVDQVIPQITRPKAVVRNELKEQCQDDFNQLRIEQAKLSNTIFDEVQRGATTTELASLYEKIEGFRPELVDLYNRTKHVVLHGALPEENKEETPSAELFSLKDRKRKLISLRNKRSTRIKEWSAIGHSQLTEWQLDLDKANAEYNLVDEQIKKITGK